MLIIKGLKSLLRATAAAALSFFVVSSAAAQTIRYIHTDGLGSVVLTTDKNRNIIERSEYEPYGSLLNHAMTDMPGYTGHVMDAATGLTYMQQRYYDPVIGRFLSADPVATNTNDGAYFNRYLYVNNNPYGFIDPDGRAPDNSILYGPGGRNNGEATSYSAVSEYSGGAYPGGGRGKQSKVTVGSFFGELIKAQLEPVRKLNASSTTALGIAIGQMRLYEAWMKGNKPYVDFGNNAVQYHNLSPVFGNAGAITFGNNIQYTLGSTPEDRQRISSMSLGYEEMQHTRQAELLGISYLPMNIALGISASIYEGNWHGPSNYLEVGPHNKEPTPWP
ncbi:RHS repeat-associated core domain-containing protein [Xanthomonas sp. NCPPB 2654]|uniref:RHS repeat domain-containing protein n=1 Tax=unclassified Xanthomonas TaxID=2643310 RepID=UPI0021E09C72|nr:MULTISPECIES: RHS repeat-associated core domain-containing protein [unclassified Xanthomonas]MDL5364119.1 RHS repeat-associated core domain-containing protein [Xanthomonas sp. NCPPB 2654]UYC20886.1 hypothetical protein NUG20_00825 [Xanthomonas sp. CFBP 8443]